MKKIIAALAVVALIGAAAFAAPRLMPQAPVDFPPPALALMQADFAGAAAALSSQSASLRGSASTNAVDAAPKASAFSAAAPRKIVRNGTLNLEVADEPKARAQARAAAAAVGAELEGDQTYGDGPNRSATLTFKVPPERFEALVEALQGVGRVTGRSVSTQNLGEEYVDLRSRLNAARRVESRLNQLLGFNTHRLTDVLQVERELERVGRDIETIEGRMKYIDALASASVLTVTLAEPGQEAAKTGVLADIRNAFVSAFNTFVGTGLALLRLTAWLAALALWVVPIGLLVWKLRK